MQPKWRPAGACTTSPRLAQYCSPCTSAGPWSAGTCHRLFVRRPVAAPARAAPVCARGPLSKLRSKRRRQVLTTTHFFQLGCFDELASPEGEGWSFYILVAEKKSVDIQTDAPRDDRRRLSDCARASPLSTRVAAPRERQGSASRKFPARAVILTAVQGLRHPRLSPLEQFERSVCAPGAELQDP